MSDKTNPDSEERVIIDTVLTENELRCLDNLNAPAITVNPKWLYAVIAELKEARLKSLRSAQAQDGVFCDCESCGKPINAGLLLECPKHNREKVCPICAMLNERPEVEGLQELGVLYFEWKQLAGNDAVSNGMAKAFLKPLKALGVKLD